MWLIYKMVDENTVYLYVLKVKLSTVQEGKRKRREDEMMADLPTTGNGDGEQWSITE